MKKEKKFEVRVTKWINNILSTVEKKFNSYKEAKEFSNEQEVGKIKIYDLEGAIIESKTKEVPNNYESGNGGDNYA